MCVYGSSCDEKSCGNCKSKRHPHADVIKAWADGAKIQVWTFLGWVDCIADPNWSTQCKYRVKPEPKPDIVISANISKRHIVDICVQYSLPHNVKFIWDGETGQLKSVEKI